MFDFLSLKKQISNLGQEVATLDQNIEKKKKEIERIKSAPLQKSDAIAYFHSRIDELAQDFDPALQFSIERLNRSPNQGLERHSNIRVLTPGREATIGSFESALLALLGTEIKHAMSARINAMDTWPEAGPPVAKRQDMIDELEKELGKMVANREELRRASAESGLLL